MERHVLGSVADLDADDEVSTDPADAEPLLPDYGGACLSEVVPTLLRLEELREADRLPPWLPAALAGAEQVVLLVLDGLGSRQLEANAEHAPALASLEGCELTSVAPTTTATALTSLSTGLVPARHGVVGYRVRAGDEVLNVLRWSTGSGDARERIVPEQFQSQPPFLGRKPPVVSRSEFASTGFTEAHLAGVPLHGWRMASSLAVEVDHLVRAGEPFVYAYYDGIDKVAHEHGLGEHYAAELGAADRLVSDLLSHLPEPCALVVTADHGQVEVRRPPIVLAPEVVADVTMLSGEGRFRWLHVEPGATARVASRCEELYGHLAWVRTRDDLVAEGWFGGPLDEVVAARLGDVALVASAPVAFHDPADTGELKLVARHGSMTAAEVLVPFVAWAP